MQKVNIRIKELREALGMTQGELAKELNVSHHCISSWEYGMSEPSLGQIKELADIFLCTIDTLLGIDDTLDSSIDNRINFFNHKNEEKVESENKVVIIKSDNSKRITINGVEIPEVRSFFIASNSEKPGAPSRLALDFDISNFHIDVQFQEDSE